jgi:hypothetical protein
MRQPKHERGSDATDGLRLADHNSLGERACQVLDRTVKELRQGQGHGTEHGSHPALYRVTQLPAPDGPGLGE